MTKQQKSRAIGKRAAWAASFVAAASLAFSPIFFAASARTADRQFSANSNSWLRTFTPAGVDSRLAKKFEQRNQAMRTTLFPFTPAGIDKGSNRTMTVAARISQPSTVSAVSVRNTIAAAAPGVVTDVRLNQSDYRLTAARGWQGFALPTPLKPVDKAPLVDLAARGNFKLDSEVKSKPSRFNTNVTLDKARQIVPSPRGTVASGEYSLNVGGSFSISRKIDVTAGVRYASERDPVTPQAVSSKDSEAVYVGTKIRF